MKYYVRQDKQIFGYDNDQLHLVTEDMREITEAEVATLTAPTPEQLAEQAKAEARAYLNSTDWYVIRQTETGVAIPENVLAKRAECRELL